MSISTCSEGKRSVHKSQIGSSKVVKVNVYYFIKIQPVLIDTFVHKGGDIFIYIKTMKLTLKTVLKSKESSVRG